MHDDLGSHDRFPSFAKPYDRSGDESWNTCRKEEVYEFFEPLKSRDLYRFFPIVFNKAKRADGGEKYWPDNSEYKKHDHCKVAFSPVEDRNGKCRERGNALEDIKDGQSD